MHSQHRLLPVLGVMALGVCLCVAVIVTLGAQTPAVVLESASAEHAIENSFFDSLAAKHHAKDRKSGNAKDLQGSDTSLSAKQERVVEDNFFQTVAKGKAAAAKPKLAGVHASHKMTAKHWKPMPYNKMVHRSHFKGMQHTAAAPKADAKGKKHTDVSMRAQFAQAQQQLHAEQTKMRHIEEHDRIKAAEQKINLERLTAHQQADAYAEHLSKLNDAVFPRSMDEDMGKSASHAVSHALTDDMHVPKITKADYERHPMMMGKMARHGSNRLYRRVKNSGKDFAKQVRTRIQRAGEESGGLVLSYVYEHADIYVRIRFCMYVCICVHVCMYVCMCVHVYSACRCNDTQVFTHVSVSASVYVCICV